MKDCWVAGGDRGMEKFSHIAFTRIHNLATGFEHHKNQFFSFYLNYMIYSYDTIPKLTQYDIQKRKNQKQ